VAKVVDAFRAEGWNFLTPPPGVPLTGDTVIDISHEALMRHWSRLRRWIQEETESAAMYRRLADAASRYAAGESALWRDPELSLALQWRHRQSPTESWARRYHPEFQGAMDFLERSQRKGRSRRAMMFSIGVVVALAVILLVLLITLVNNS
jgi:hypothetical protein